MDKISVLESSKVFCHNVDDDYHKQSLPLSGYWINLRNQNFQCYNLSALQMQQVQSTYIFEELFCKFSNMLYNFWWIALFSFNSLDFKGHQLFLKEERIKKLIIQRKKNCFLLNYEMLNWNQGKKDEHWKMCDVTLVWNMRHFQFQMQGLLPDRKSYTPKPVLSHFYTSIHISHRYYYNNTELISHSSFNLHSTHSQHSKNYSIAF